MYLGGVISPNRDLSVEVTRRIQRAWACFGWYKTVVSRRPGVRLPLKVPLLKTGVLGNAAIYCTGASRGARNRPTTGIPLSFFSGTSRSSTQNAVLWKTPVTKNQAFVHIRSIGRYDSRGTTCHWEIDKKRTTGDLYLPASRAKSRR